MPTPFRIEEGRGARGLRAASSVLFGSFLFFASVLCATLLLVSQTCDAAATTAAAPTPGPAVVIGGGLREGNAGVWERIVALAGGRGARIAVLPTASGDPEAAAKDTVATLRRYGADAFWIPVAPGLKGTDALAAARDPRWVEQIAGAGGVYFTGGAQADIVDTLEPGGHPSPLLEAIRALQRRGGVIAGSSAGAAIMSRTMIRDAEDVFAVLKGRMREGHELGTGLGFATDRFIVDQHFLARGRIGRLLPVMVERGFTVGLGVDEDTAAIVNGDSVEVIGASGVLLIELDEADRAPGRKPFAVRNARLSLLADGDRVDLRTRTVTPSESKLAGQLVDPMAAGFKPEYEGVPFYLDVLGAHTVREAMVRLLDSAASEARGLAFDPRAPADDPLRDLGFEFRFYKAPGTRGWYASVGDSESYTVVAMRLDVTPVRVARPLYVPWSP
jgi:cyanophycinase